MLPSSTRPKTLPKGAIVSFTRSLAQVLAKKHIRVNAVAPGPVWTPLIPSSFSEEHVAKHGGVVPLAIDAQPNDIAPCYGVPREPRVEVDYRPGLAPERR